MDARSIGAGSAPRNIVAGLSGIVFGAGLGVSHMVNPQKVRDFLDFTGTWDPSLALVMGAAVVVFFIAWRLALARTRPLLADRFHWPTATALWDARMLGGAAIFGIGWGLVGLCPGPAIASLAYLLPQSAVFVLAAVAGSLAASRWPTETAPRASPSTAR